MNEVPERRVISLEELEERIKNRGPNVALSDIQVEGVAVIKDKDGNIKSEMKITSLEIEEDPDHAIS